MKKLQWWSIKKNEWSKGETNTKIWSLYQLSNSKYIFFHHNHWILLSILNIIFVMSLIDFIWAFILHGSRVSLKNSWSSHEPLSLSDSSVKWVGSFLPQNWFCEGVIRRTHQRVCCWAVALSLAHTRISISIFSTSRDYLIKVKQTGQFSVGHPSSHAGWMGKNGIHTYIFWNCQCKSYRAR